MVFLERLPSGREIPFAISYLEIKRVSLGYWNQHTPMISIHRQDNTAEYFSILQDDSDAIDTERTRSVFEFVNKSVAANALGAGGYTTTPNASK